MPDKPSGPIIADASAILGGSSALNETKTIIVKGALATSTSAVAIVFPWAGWIVGARAHGSTSWILGRANRIYGNYPAGVISSGVVAATFNTYSNWVGREKVNKNDVLYITTFGDMGGSDGFFVTVELEP